MSAIKQYILAFKNRGGVFVFISTFLVKFISALLSIIVIRFLTKNEYAHLSYILSVYSILFPFIGLGGQFSLLRFGSISKSVLYKYQLFIYTLKRGLLYTVIILFILLITELIIPLPDLNVKYVLLLALSLLSIYLTELIRSYYRILNLNKWYSIYNIINTLISFILTIILTIVFKVEGYIIAMIFTPIITYISVYKYIPRVSVDSINRLSENGYWKYGVETSLGSIASQIIFSIGPLILTLLGDSDADVANFKVSTIIPFNLLIIPNILLLTDFNYIARNSYNKNVLISYYIGYLKTMLLILPLFAIAIIFREDIIHIVFGEEYVECKNYFTILLISAYVSFIFRNPLGNILLAVGKANWNCWNAYISSFIYILLIVLLYPYIGTISAVYSLLIVFLLSSLMSFFLFIRYINSFKSV